MREQDAAAVEELYSVHARLDGLAAYRAASQMTAEVLDRLEESCARFDALRAADDVNELVRENCRFGRVIADAVASPRSPS